MNIGFRVDGGPGIGMGHVMRCLSLANEFKKKIDNVFFMDRHKEGIDAIKGQGFDVIEIKALDLSAEALEIAEILQNCALELLIVDSYNISQEYFLKIKPAAGKLGYIDDINRFTYPVDILINGNINGQHLGYNKYSDGQVMLLGPEYNLVRDEFRGIGQRAVNREVKQIMITTGGSDPYDMSVKIINSLLGDKELKSLGMNIVVGGAFHNKEELKHISRHNPNVILHQNVKQISRIMLESDIAISAGGSTLYELCACGTPTIAFVMADNQEGVVGKMSELGYVQSLGWYDGFSECELLEGLKGLCRDYERRAALSRRMQALIDGKGVQRVAERVMRLLEGSDNG